MSWAPSVHALEPDLPAPTPARAVPALRLPLPLKLAFAAALLALTVLDRFGLRVTDSFSLSPTLLALYGLVVAMLLTRSLRVDRRALLLVIAALGVAGLSFVVNDAWSDQQFTSPSSLALLAVLYLPLALTLNPALATALRWRRLMRGFLGVATLCAVAGIVQFYAQYAFHASWLFDYREQIPAVIRGSGIYNTVNPVGALIKSNGFFLREASGFSALMALALLCELSLFRRKLCMALFVLGMLLSYSGSGPLVLAVALLFPLSLKTVLRVAAVVCVGAVFLLLFGDALNLSYTVGRVGEFGSTQSSAYCRFIAPAQLVADQLDSQPWALLLGHGPGTTQKLSGVCETTYGKLMFEYGAAGFLLFSALVVGAIQRHAAPLRVRVALIVQWFLLGGFLLSADVLLLIVVLCSLWPPGLATSSPTEEAP